LIDDAKLGNLAFISKYFSKYFLLCTRKSYFCASMFAQSPFRIVLLFVVLAGVGFALLPLVAVELNPRPVLPVLTVSYTLPQSSPEVVEARASAPLENVFSQLRELKKITSVSRYDGGSITLHFDKHTDLNFRRFEVASLIRRTYPTLPQSLTYPQIRQGTERKKQGLPLLSYSINAPYTPTQIKQTIENQVQKQLLLIEGISQVEVRGATDRQVTIAYNAEKLAQHQLSPQDIEQTIRQYNAQTHLGGHLTPAGERLYFKTFVALCCALWSLKRAIGKLFVCKKWRRYIGKNSA
jgi:multidrug efflux pump subunit AcrB